MGLLTEFRGSSWVAYQELARPARMQSSRPRQLQRHVRHHSLSGATALLPRVRYRLFFFILAGADFKPPLYGLFSPPKNCSSPSYQGLFPGRAVLSHRCVFGFGSSSNASTVVLLKSVCPAIQGHLPFPFPPVPPAARRRRGRQRFLLRQFADGGNHSPFSGWFSS